MANVPTTIIVKSEDLVNCPISYLFIAMKRVFRYGLKDIKRKGNTIIIQLFYSPKNESLKRKFGDLPLSYIRLNLESDEELGIFENLIKKYNFDLPSEEDSDKTTQPTIEDGEEGPSSVKRLKIADLQEEMFKDVQDNIITKQ